MSRFSKAEAEKLGWRFTHEADEEVLREGGEQGVRRVKPAQVTAEKTQEHSLGESIITETAETMGLLLERINAYEQFQARVEPVEDPSAVTPYGDIPELKLRDEPKVSTADNDIEQIDNESLHEAGDPHVETVKTPDGDFSERDWFGRKSDEAQAAHAALLERQREAELAKPIDPQLTEDELAARVVPEPEEAPKPKRRRRRSKKS